MGQGEVLSASSGLSGLCWVGCLWGPLVVLAPGCVYTTVGEGCVWTAHVLCNSIASCIGTECQSV